MTCTPCLVCFISTLNGRSNNNKKKWRAEAYPWKAGTSSGHVTNLKQSILETLDIFELHWLLGDATLTVLMLNVTFLIVILLHFIVMLSGIKTIKIPLYSLTKGHIFSMIFTHLATQQTARNTDSKSTHPSPTLVLWLKTTIFPPPLSYQSLQQSAILAPFLY